jgi:membrane-associated protease RseP (regulator of RpoE activity)
MRNTTLLAGVLAVGVAAGALTAQTTRIEPAPARVRVFPRDDDDRPMLGITVGSSGLRDTLGLLITGVTAGGPADKAGIEEGNRIAAINGVNLRAEKADAEDNDASLLLTNRLTRALGKAKAGEEVELRVWTGGQYKTMKVKPVSANELSDRRTSSRRDTDRRPVLGLSLSATGSRRDSGGLLVVRVAPDGPAEKAGIVEGDRVSGIGTADLRVAREDAGDGYASSIMMNRYRREINKLEVGQDIDVRVNSGGRTHTVKVKPVRASELPRTSGYFYMGDGQGFFDGFGGTMPLMQGFPGAMIAPVPPMPPMPSRAPRIFEYDNDGRGDIELRLSPRIRTEVRARTDEALQRVRELMDRNRTLLRLRGTWDREFDDDDLDTPTPPDQPAIAAPRAISPRTPAPAKAAAVPARASIT